MQYNLIFPGLIAYRYVLYNNKKLLGEIDIEYLVALDITLYLFKKFNISIIWGTSHQFSIQ